ncbi:MAG: hypothetical protein HMLIMOIP_000788 [Candidatus Nitrosomirales archaeon]|jgi:hypothetical protein
MTTLYPSASKEVVKYQLLDVTYVTTCYIMLHNTDVIGDNGTGAHHPYNGWAGTTARAINGVMYPDYNDPAG